MNYKQQPQNDSFNMSAKPNSQKMTSQVNNAIMKPSSQIKMTNQTNQIYSQQNHDMVKLQKMLNKQSPQNRGSGFRNSNQQAQIASHPRNSGREQVVNNSLLRSKSSIQMQSPKNVQAPNFQMNMNMADSFSQEQAFMQQYQKQQQDPRNRGDNYAQLNNSQQKPKNYPEQQFLNQHGGQQHAQPQSYQLQGNQQLNPQQKEAELNILGSHSNHTQIDNNNHNNNLNDQNKWAGQQQGSSAIRQQQTNYYQQENLSGILYGQFDNKGQQPIKNSIKLTPEQLRQEHLRQKYQQPSQENNLLNSDNLKLMNGNFESQSHHDPMTSQPLKIATSQKNVDVFNAWPQSQLSSITQQNQQLQPNIENPEDFSHNNQIGSPQKNKQEDELELQIQNFMNQNEATQTIFPWDQFRVTKIDQQEFIYRSLCNRIEKGRELLRWSLQIIKKKQERLHMDKIQEMRNLQIQVSNLKKEQETLMELRNSEKNQNKSLLQRFMNIVNAQQKQIDELRTQLNIFIDGNKSVDRFRFADIPNIEEERQKKYKLLRKELENDFTDDERESKVFQLEQELEKQIKELQKMESEASKQLYEAKSMFEENKLKIEESYKKMSEIKNFTMVKNTSKDEKMVMIQQLNDTEQQYRDALERKKVSEATIFQVTDREAILLKRMQLSEKFSTVYREFMEIYEEYKAQKFKMIDYEQIFKKLLIENQQAFMELNGQKVELEKENIEFQDIEDLDLVLNHPNYDDNQMMKLVLSNFGAELNYPADLKYSAKDDMPQMSSKFLKNV